MDNDDRAILLDYLVEITAQRDAEILEITLLMTIVECFDIKKACLCMIHFDTREIYRIREAADGLAVRECEDDEIRDLNDTLGPSLRQASDNHKIETIESNDDTILIYPLFIMNINTGFILIYQRRNGRVDVQLMMSFLKVYSNYVTLLVDSQRDSLTGLMNRKTFDDKILGVIDFKRKMESGLFPGDQKRRETEIRDDFWLGIFDIDDFKSINDRYGHLYGDEVLILLGRMMRDNFRTTDIMIRYGGEEFIVIIRAINENEAFFVFDRFRSMLENHRFSRIGQITVSIGLKQILKGDPPTVIVGHADQALYYAKNAGKNRVCVYEQLIRDGLLKDEISEGEIHYF
ncbi:MAG: GGDEF domain-containing protein [Spirochaetes bacterium]|nr:GGDEF domain-containing protein [Spirochaetota bacterium]